MLVVAILRCAGEDEWRARVLGAVTGATLPEARRRARPPGPKVVAASRDREDVDRMVAALQREGLEPFWLDDDDLRLPDRSSPKARGSVRVRTIRAAEASGLSGLDGAGRPWSCSLASIAAIVRGVRSQSETRTSTDFDRRIPPERGLLGAAAAQPRSRRREVETRHGFAHVFVRDHPTLVLDEEWVSYEGLGAERRQSRAANFARLLELLRAATPGAPFDDRLSTLDGQRHLMGGVLDPRRYLEVATAVLGHFLTAQSGPYR